MISEQACDFLEAKECGCVDRCEAIPAPIPYKRPAAIPNNRDFIAFYVFLAAIAIIGMGTAHQLQKQEVQLTQQARV